MSLRMTEEEYRAFMRARGKDVPQAETKEVRRKYRNIPTTVEGKKFPSIHEAETYKLMKLQWRNGKFLGLATQVEFLLPGGVVYRCDFVTLNKDGTYTVFDAKSVATKEDKAYKIKKKQMKNCIGIEIQEI